MADLTGYFDLQVNGYGGVDFNSDLLTGDALHAACEKLQAGGVAGILGTIISAQIDVMIRRLTALKTLREKDPLAKQIIAGFHIEGPFINERDGYRGAHSASAIRPADCDAMERLLDATDGLTRIVTLAPERDDGFSVTRMLAKRGIIVSAGHTDASLDELRGAIDNGLSMFTHVGNGCPMLMHRHDNIVQRALSLSDRLWLTFIADGAHVAWPALGNYLRAARLWRCIVVTDAIAAAGLGPGRYTLGHWDLMIGEDMVARAPDGSHLVGSAGTMQRSEKNLTEHIGLTEAQLRMLLIENPRKAIELPC
jgi:N-acetylglucosamine-6-phosphate deacetylase